MTEHTKAPWRKSGALVLDDRQRVICYTQPIEGASSAEQDANGLLLAAAPDLLEVCRRLVTVMGDRKFRGGPEPMVAEELNDIIAAANVALSKCD